MQCSPGEIARRWVRKKTKTIWRTQVRKFHFASICNIVPDELRLFWYSTRVLNRHLANKLPTCGQQLADSRPTNGQQSADCWQKIFVKAVNNSRPTVGQLSSHFWPTVGRQSADSFLGELFFLFSEIAVVWMCSFITHSKERCVSVRFYQESALL